MRESRAEKDRSRGRERRRWTALGRARRSTRTCRWSLWLQVKQRSARPCLCRRSWRARIISHRLAHRLASGQPIPDKFGIGYVTCRNCSESPLSMVYDKVLWPPLPHLHSPTTPPVLFPAASGCPRLPISFTFQQRLHSVVLKEGSKEN